MAAQAAPAHPAILAGSLDAPRPGAISPGRGVEISGWALSTPQYSLDAVFPVVEGVRGALHPLNVPRPDVAADYSSTASVNCGFSFWCSLPESASARIQLVAVSSSGELIPLLDLHVAEEEDARSSIPGLRPVNAPDFVIIGAQRGGTTSLHAYLRSHPDIDTPAKKEIHFLTDRFERGADWYIGQFPAAVPEATVVGEATPYALFHPLAPLRLREVAPTAKIIVLLRNPVDRAYSHYQHERARGHENLSFEDALAAEPSRLSGVEEQLISGEILTSDVHKRASYVARGRYAEQLERWFSVFPRQQFMILRSEDLYAGPAAVTRQVTEFLGIQPLTDEIFSAHNASAGPPMQEATRDMLIREYRSDNARLARLLDWNAAWA